MQKNTGTGQGGKKQADFDAAFDKYAKMLNQDYKNQFKKVEYAGAATKQQKINQAVRSGKQVEYVKKGGGNKNESVKIGEILNDDSIIEIKENPKELGIQVSQKRNELNLSQDQLAKKINELTSVIKDMENGTGAYNPNIVIKIEKALGFKIDRSAWKQKEK